MTKRPILALVALAVAVPTVSATPAFADPPPWAPAHGRRAKDAQSLYYADRYYRAGRHYPDRVLTRGDRIYRGGDGRYYCHRSDGTTGLIVGAAVGALIGRSLDRGQSRTAGTLIGAGAGVLLGRAIDRGQLRCD